jgi:hypothetical protein
MPKMVEIDEVELLQSQKLRDTVAKIMAHPEAALKVEEAYKMVDPKAVTPRLDQAKVAKEPVEAVQKQLDDLKASIAKEQSERADAAKRSELLASVQSGLARLRANGWTDDGIKGVEKIMEEKGILDADIAAAYFEKMHPPQSPVTPGGNSAWNFMDQAPDGDADLKKLVETKGEHEGLIQKMAFDALNEVRGGSRR